VLTPLDSTQQRTLVLLGSENMAVALGDETKVEDETKAEAEAPVFDVDLSRRRQLLLLSTVGVLMTSLVGGVAFWVGRRAAGHESSASPSSSVGSALVAPAPVTAERMPPSMTASASPRVEASEPASVPAPPAEGSVAASAPPAAASSAPAEPNPKRARELGLKAQRLLEANKFEGTIEAARESIEADPTDALPYLCWGTALLNTGKAAEAKEVFERCAKHATRGQVRECRLFR
jgi:hypothetical protein